MKKLLLFIVVLLSSCSTNTVLVDNDDMYINKRDSLVVRRTRVYRAPTEIYYGPNYGWNYWDYNMNPFRFYPPRQVIIIERNNNFNYGKRPTREGIPNNTPSNIRRGRN